MSLATSIFSSLSERAVEPAAVPQARPKVAIICNSLPPYRVHLHRRIVHEMGGEIELCTLCTHETSGDGWKFEAPPEINPTSFGKGHTVWRQTSLIYTLSEWYKGGRIIEWIISHRVSAVVMLGYNDPGRLRIIRWCRRNRLPLLLWGDSNIYGDTATGFKARFKSFLLRPMMSSCSALLPCGTCGRAYFARYGGRPDRMFYFPYEPDYQLIRDLSSEFIESVRTRYELPRGRRRFVFSARMVPIKRPDLLIDAFLTIASQRPDWDLLMLGEGTLRPDLMARIPDALKHRVVWTGFIDDQAIISALYRLSDCLVLPSDFEPWALVINEAAAAGLAIISSMVVGASVELVRDGINGRIFPTGDGPALADAMLDVSAPDHIDATKAASAGVLERWRRRGDPIGGLRRALRFAGIMGAGAV